MPKNSDFHGLQLDPRGSELPPASSHRRVPAPGLARRPSETAPGQAAVGHRPAGVRRRGPLVPLPALPPREQVAPILQQPGQLGAEVVEVVVVRHVDHGPLDAPAVQGQLVEPGQELLGLVRGRDPEAADRPGVEVDRLVGPRGQGPVEDGVEPLPLLVGDVAGVGRARRHGDAQRPVPGRVADLPVAVVVADQEVHRVGQLGQRQLGLLDVAHELPQHLVAEQEPPRGACEGGVRLREVGGPQVVEPEDRRCCRRPYDQAV